MRRKDKVMENSINSIIEECLQEGKQHFFIFPYGKIGMQVEEILTRKYGIENIIRVDNYLCKYNKKIVSCKIFEEHTWDEKDIVLIASNSCEYYNNIRLETSNYVPPRNSKDLFPINPLLTNGDQRVASLAAVAREIYRKGIVGSVAEAGVYRGDFSRFINILFPDRKLFLFDSFEGFDRENVVNNYDNSLQTDSFINRLTDTSIDIVMEKMVFPQNVVIKKGYIPMTFKNIEEKFCFVNLDMDLYKPTYEALQFFWDNLNAGGYIFVHDFYIWDGIEPAVKQFCREKKIGYMCLTDRCSIAIAKPIL